MKKILFSLLVILSLDANCQYVTTFAKNADILQSDGVVYYLPQNVIRVDFIIEQTQNFKGPYSDYAVDILAVNDYIKQNSTSYSIKNISVSIDCEPDPNAVFYITTEEKNKEPHDLDFCFSNDGIILAFGYNSDELEVKDLSKIDNSSITDTYEYNISLEDTIMESNVYFCDIIKNSEEKLSKKEKVQHIVENIEKTKQAYYDLISGFQEINYGSTINYMSQKLMDLENEYLSLFLGKSVKKVIKKTIYFIPEKGQENGNITIAKFSENEGLISSNEREGEAIKIQFNSPNSFSNVNAITQDVIKSASYNNKLFYRIPRNTTMKVYIGKEQFIEQRLKISQFGTIMLAPMNKMKLLFDPMTGQIISMTKK